MKLKFEEYAYRFPKRGWCMWEIDYWTKDVHLCRWWAYPFYQLYRAGRNTRIGLYHWLNRIGIMKTPLGNRMVLSDIWRRKAR